jgi:hypothetical protein
MVLAEIGSRKDLVRVLVFSVAAIWSCRFLSRAGRDALCRDVGSFPGVGDVYCPAGIVAGNVRWRVVCGALLVLVGFKLAAERLFGWRWVNWEHESGIFTATLVHSAGVVSGLLVWFVQSVKGRSGLIVAREGAGIDQSRQASWQNAGFPAFPFCE